MSAALRLLIQAALRAAGERGLTFRELRRRHPVTAIELRRALDAMRADGQVSQEVGFYRWRGRSASTWRGSWSAGA